MTTSFRSWPRAAALMALTAAASATVFAQPAAGDGSRGRQMAADLQKRFVAADANKDGKLTRDEAKAGMPFVYKHFDEIDTGKKGALSMQDIAVFFREKAAARKAGT